MQTYRYRGHSMSARRNIAPARSHKIRHDQDPIEQVRNRLLAAKMSEQELKRSSRVREVVNAAADFAQTSEPTAAELYTDIYR